MSRYGMLKNLAAKALDLVAYIAVVLVMVNDVGFTVEPITGIVE